MGRRRGARKAGGKQGRRQHGPFPRLLSGWFLSSRPCPVGLTPACRHCFPLPTPSAPSSLPAFCSPLHSPLSSTLPISLPLSRPPSLPPYSYIFWLRRKKGCRPPVQASQRLHSDGMFQSGGRPVKQRCLHSQKPGMAGLRGLPWFPGWGLWGSRSIEDG